jgi:hypothetical protein
MDDRATPPRRSAFALAVRLLVALLLALTVAYVGYLAIALGPAMKDLNVADFVRGYERILEPADVRQPVLRSEQGGADRVYLLTTQSERIVPIRGFRSSAARPRQALHVDLWAFDVATAKPAWRRRLRTFEDRGTLMHEILGIDAGTLWVFVREPIGVKASDGTVVADGARIEARNPPLAGKRVDQHGYVAFGAQGLQLTLSDATQWVVHADLAAEPRDVAPKTPEHVDPPAYRGSYTSSFQMRGMPIGTMWLGVLTDEEAKELQGPVVVPGRKPGERPGVMEEFYETQHVPGDLTAQPKPYGLWSAKLTKVSNAPRDWPKDFPDNWGTRDELDDYKRLPDAPTFLQAGLLGDGRSKSPAWYREPDSVVVLHHDKVGDAGRLRLARVAGPAGRLVWDTPLALANLNASMYGRRTLAFFGAEPNPAYDPQSERAAEHLEKLVVVDVAGGTVATFDMTTESVREGDGAVAAAP